MAKGVYLKKETILSLEKGAKERWRNGDPGGFVELSDEDITYVDSGLTKPRSTDLGTLRAVAADVKREGFAVRSARVVVSPMPSGQWNSGPGPARWVSSQL